MSSEHLDSAEKHIEFLEAVHSKGGISAIFLERACELLQNKRFMRDVFTLREKYYIPSQSSEWKDFWEAYDTGDWEDRKKYKVFHDIEGFGRLYSNALQRGCYPAF